VTVDPFTGFTWLSPNGSTWDLMDLDGATDQLFTAQGVSGLGSAPRSVIADALPLGGTIVRTSLPQPRIITIPLTLGSDTIANFVATQRSLVEAFTCTDRLGPGQFVVTRGDGSSRQIPAIYYAGLEGSNDLGLAYGSLVVQLYCPDPFFTDTTPTIVTFPAATPQNFLSPYLTVISSQVLGNLTVEIDGSQPTFPTWIFTGPFSQAVCTGANGSFTIARPAAAGETYTVNTNPTLTSAVSSDGTNLFPFVNFPAASFFQLNPGANALTLELDDDGPSTFGVLSYAARRETA
jgi:hypothetical protein